MNTHYLRELFVSINKRIALEVIQRERRKQMTIALNTRQLQSLAGVKFAGEIKQL